MIWHITQIVLMTIVISYFYNRIKKIEMGYICDLKLRVKYLEETVKSYRKKTYDYKDATERNKTLIEYNKEITTSISNLSRRNREMLSKK